MCLSVGRTDDTTTLVGNLHKYEQQLSDSGGEKQRLLLLMCTRSGSEQIKKNRKKQGN